MKCIWIYNLFQHIIFYIMLSSDPVSIHGQKRIFESSGNEIDVAIHSSKDDTVNKIHKDTFHKT